MKIQRQTAYPEEGMFYPLSFALTRVYQLRDESFFVYTECVPCVYCENIVDEQYNGVYSVRYRVGQHLMWAHAHYIQ